ncbi:MAG: TerC family protein [Gammaproteobacteria bacterium]|nr:TerC family protein [Gammaproteobacteria bacterium]
MLNYFHSAISLCSLIIIEIVLGIDNLIFLAILTERLPAHLRRKVRSIGLTGAWVLRLALLFSALWITKLQQPLFVIHDLSFSLRELFFILGGGFLVYKSIIEIGNELDFLEKPKQNNNQTVSSTVNGLGLIIMQVMVMDLVFSVDSILTAVGLTQMFEIMAIAITISIIVMFYFSEGVSHFIHQYPSIKMLALSFLVMIGIFLISDGFSYEIPRNYLYFSMFFSFLVEGLNLLHRHRKSNSKGKK